MEYLINILLVAKVSIFVLLIVLVLLVLMFIKMQREKDDTKKVRYTSTFNLLTWMAYGQAFIVGFTIATNPITKPMTTNTKFVPEAVVEQVQEKAGDPLPSRLREPKQSNIQEKIDIKDEVQEILKK